ncbi:hydroxysteroid (20-beta) dehydrogenase 2 [Gadus macrocephalus]|uniref:hydroxysteroid (20-beta) dehydrogenase 2 n=1 Tax=Gadus macrocephalus TaxID=80720 RepID=UPI0028CB2D64|nr:hydroxysteroid (20-beta) dehydrogenase 2 [Gadus macrocephalus]
MDLMWGLAVVGAVSIGWILLKVLWTCWCGFTTFFLSEIWRVDLKKYGKWAVVTGATSGIGRAYAKELARRGLDVVLISRSNEKLQMVAEEIEAEYGRRTLTIQTDFTGGGSIYPAIEEALRGIDIGILVNNVGMSYSGSFSQFLDVPDSELKISQVVNCNMLSVTQMTRIVLPDMVKRGSGLIINIGSEIGARPYPFLSLYCATKVFVRYISLCLDSEYRSKGITVQCVAPLLVSTNMTFNCRVNGLVKSASDFAREALNTVGYTNYTNGCVSHRLQSFVLKLGSGLVHRLAYLMKKPREVPENLHKD